MLGTEIYQGTGKRTGRRVLSVSPSFTVEVSFEEAGKLLGLDVMFIATYTASPRADGSLQGEGHGVFAALSGEQVTVKGIGTGKLDSSGAVSYCGAVTYNTTSEKLAGLNTVAGAFEFRVDADGTTHTKVWEWKVASAAASA